MARTRRTIPLDEKIEKAQAAVFQAKDMHLGVRQCALKGASHSGQETSTR